MVTKSITITLMLIVALASIYSTCSNGVLSCANTVYSFQIPEKITPDKDSIHIGDTIFFTVNAPTKLKDLSSGNIIDYSDCSNLGTYIRLLKFLPENNDVGAIKNFDFVFFKGTKGNPVDPFSQEGVFFAEENGMYKCSVAIIPKDTGRYVLTTGDANNVFRKTDNCTKAHFTINMDSTDQHFYLLNLWRPDAVLEELGKSRVYYFKVY